MAASTQPIIIKRKGGHAGHHGGAWKVAYADFVTAMMALFIVLWLMNTSKPVQEAISGYFKDPSGTGKLMGTTQAPAKTISKDDMAKVKAELEKAIQQMTELRQAEEPDRAHRNHRRVTYRAAGIAEGHILREWRYRSERQRP
jgi:chemotaxis protein MotB